MGVGWSRDTSPDDSQEERVMREVRRELVDYIREKTGLDRKTIMRVLLAEESFFVMQVEGVLKKSGRGRS